MGSNEQKSTQQEKEFGMKLCGIVGAAVWWFLSSEPSTFALMLAAFALFNLFLGYILLAVLLPGPDAEESKEAFVPLPQSEVNRPKALTL
jgi:heme/copper-type cytochrome/quinol oxidase subunit 3